MSARTHRWAAVAAALAAAGCGFSSGTSAGRYPALDESPPPPAPPAEALVEEVPAAPETAEPPSVIAEDSWSRRQREREELVSGLRKYAAEAGPDDPFALTEEQIQALAAREDVIIN